MTLPAHGKKLSKQESESIKIAIEQAGIRAVHPDRMEAYGMELVERLKKQE
jgi:hypothetical protein